MSTSFHWGSLPRNCPLVRSAARTPDKSSGQVSRLLKRLRLHGFVKKVGRTYRYYLTHLGKEIIAAALKLKELVLIPQLAFGPAS